MPERDSAATARTRPDRASLINVVSSVSLGEKNAAIHTLFALYRGSPGAGVIRRLDILTIRIFAIGGMCVFRRLDGIEQAMQIPQHPGYAV